MVNNSSGKHILEIFSEKITLYFPSKEIFFPFIYNSDKMSFLPKVIFFFRSKLDMAFLFTPPKDNKYGI